MNHLNSEMQKEKARTRAKKWYQENKTKALTRIGNRAKGLKPQKKEYDYNYRVLNSDKIRDRLRAWYKTNREKQKNKASVWKQKNPEKARYNRYLESAKKRKCQFGLDFEMFVEVINMPCVYCGFKDDESGVG